MGAIVSTLRPGLKLAKLEDDAAFMYAITETLDGSMLLDTIERCYFSFRCRRRDVRQAASCECNACVRIPDLDLKFVVHHGTILRQRVAGRAELFGSDVILAHRLLKNDVVASTGIDAYALFTQQCIDALDVDVSDLDMRASSARSQEAVASTTISPTTRSWLSARGAIHVLNRPGPMTLPPLADPGPRHSAGLRPPGLRAAGTSTHGGRTSWLPEKRPRTIAPCEQSNTLSSAGRWPSARCQSRRCRPTAQ